MPAKPVCTSSSNILRDRAPKSVAGNKRGMPVDCAEEDEDEEDEEES